MVPVPGALLESGIDLGPLLPHHLSEVVVGIILMLLVFLVMWKVVVPAFEKLYDERYQRIVGGIRRAEQADAKAEEALAEYNDQLNSAREEAARIREEAKTAGAQLLAEARERASRESDRILAAGRAQLEAERAQLMTELRGEIGGLATTLAGKIVGESLADDERANRTVDRFLDELEAAAR